jgi:hypothetical protein
MKSYYALQGSIHYYGRLPKTIEIVPDGAVMGTPGDVRGILGDQPIDILRWKDPPHLFLANLPVNDDLGGSVRFPDTAIREEGRKAIASFIRQYGPLYMRGYLGENRFHERVSHFTQFQRLLREAWQGNDAAVRNLEARIEVRGSRAKCWLSIKEKRVEVHVTDLERFICILFVRDYAIGTAKICANLDCPAPYFLQQRKGQQFCTHKCAVLINVRRFREREMTQKNERGRRDKDDKPGRSNRIAEPATGPGRKAGKAMA